MTPITLPTIAPEFDLSSLLVLFSSSGYCGFSSYSSGTIGFYSSSFSIIIGMIYSSSSIIIIIISS